MAPTASTALCSPSWPDNSINKWYIFLSFKLCLEYRFCVYYFLPFTPCHFLIWL
jgi:hypothetical protein